MCSRLRCVNIIFAVFIEPVLRIWDPVPFFDPWIRDPGWVKNQDPDPE